MGDNVYSAIKYRTRAVKRHAEAEEIANAQAKGTLLKIAADYETLADSMDAKVRRQ